MLHYIKELKRISSEKNISLKILAEKIGMTEAGFHQSMNKNTLRLDKLFKICEVLEITPADILEKEIQELKENNPVYGLSDQDILREMFKSIKRIENKLFESDPGK